MERDWRQRIDVLEERFGSLRHPEGRLWKILVLGSGMVGKHAVDASIKAGEYRRDTRKIWQSGTGQAMVRSRWAQCVERSETVNAGFVQEDRYFSRCDQPPKFFGYQWCRMGGLPGCRIMLCWLTWQLTRIHARSEKSPVVRGIEGIPKGDLDQYIFYPDDPHIGWIPSLM